jgi:hypothetical protein
VRDSRRSIDAIADRGLLKKNRFLDLRGNSRKNWPSAATLLQSSFHDLRPTAGARGRKPASAYRETPHRKRDTPERSIITVKAERRDKDITIAITDTGYGIPTHQQEKLFSKFFRGENVVSLDTNGTGLGLYMAGLLVQLLKGSISFVSEGGKGTTFTLSLPNTRAS